MESSAIIFYSSVFAIYLCFCFYQSCYTLNLQSPIDLVLFFLFISTHSRLSPSIYPNFKFIHRGSFSSKEIAFGSIDNFIESFIIISITIHFSPSLSLILALILSLFLSISYLLFLSHPLSLPLFLPPFLSLSLPLFFSLSLPLFLSLCLSLSPSFFLSIRSISVLCERTISHCYTDSYATWGR